MRRVVKNISFLVMSGLLALLLGCAPEVGSDRWCAQIKAKSKADWTMNEAADYAKHCAFK